MIIHLWIELSFSNGESLILVITKALRTDGLTDGRTRPPLMMREHISQNRSKCFFCFSFSIIAQLVDIPSVIIFIIDVGGLAHWRRVTALAVSLLFCVIGLLPFGEQINRLI